MICDYAKAERPHIPFPYFAETMTGFEYIAAVLMMNWGMVAEGLECVRNTRSRYDGEKRNPWDEAECGHHYARAMSSWSAIVALSGFSYDGATSSVAVTPKVSLADFRCFWSTGTGWGTFSLRSRSGGAVLTLKVLAGSLDCRSCEMEAPGTKASVLNGERSIESQLERRNQRLVATFSKTLRLASKEELRIEVHG